MHIQCLAFVPVGAPAVVREELLPVITCSIQCIAFDLNEERRARGKHVARAVEAIYLGFATDHNMSAYKFFIPEGRKLMLCNQARFDELIFPLRKQSIIEQDKDDHRTNILTRDAAGSKWVPYDKSLPTSAYEKVHYDAVSDVLVLRLKGQANTFTKVTQMQYFQDILKAQTAYVASLRVVQGLPEGIDPDRPPKNYKDAIIGQSRPAPR